MVLVNSDQFSATGMEGLILADNPVVLSSVARACIDF